MKKANGQRKDVGEERDQRGSRRDVEKWKSNVVASKTVARGDDVSAFACTPSWRGGKTWKRRHC